MFQSKSNKLLMSSTLALIILCSALAASHVGTAQATEVTLWASLGPDPFWGYYAGYHDIWYRIQPEWEKLGIDLELYFQGDMYDNWYLIWESPLGGRPPGKPPGHWDLTSFEWWIHPTGFLWQDAIMLANMIPPPGANAEPYLSRESDELYRKMQTIGFEADVRKSYCWAWQEYMMHNPPVINWYYPHIYYMAGKYITGYDFTVWWYDLSHLSINQTFVNQTWAPGTDLRKRLSEDKTLIYGASEAWWGYLTQFVDSYTEEQYANLVWGSLYKCSLTDDGWSDVEAGKLPDVEDYIFRPWLASDDPILLGWETDLTDNTQVYRVRIPLREGVVWSDGHPFDAEDVKFSYDLTLNPEALTTGYGDFAPIVKRVEYVNDIPPRETGYNATAIDLVLYEPYVDLKLILGNVWGVGIMPHHALKDVDPKFMRSKPVNTKFSGASALPQIGPFLFEAEGTPAGYSWISFKKNPRFFGYNASIVGEPWGPYNVERIRLEYIPDAETRFSAIQTHEIDFGEYPVAPAENFEALMGEPDLFIQRRRYVASNVVYMNFNNLHLSNRYVRLALAYATPYDTIFAEILPSWGVLDPIPGTTYVLPWSVYTEPAVYGGDTVNLYNTEIKPYTYDLDIAQKYLDMWKYSQTDEPQYDKGCVGDADFNGIVDLDDLSYWLDEWGREYPGALRREIDWWKEAYGEWFLEHYGDDYPWPITGDPTTSSIAPGNDIDADFDNDGDVDVDDFNLWFAHWGDEYPFPGAW